MKILLLNSHSPYNAGDLAILRETLAYLQAAFPNAQITVSMNDLDVTKLPSGADYVASFSRWLVQMKPSGEWRWRKQMALPYAGWLLLGSLLHRLTNVCLLPYNADRRRLMRAYYAADLVVVIGGGHLYGLRALNITFFWLWLGLALAVVMGKPLIFLPQSFGPVTGAVQRYILRWLLEQSSFVATREYRSLALLAAIGLRRRVVVLPDLAFTVAEASDRVLEQTIPEYTSLCQALCAYNREEHEARVDCTSKRPLIGLTLMNWGEQNPRFANQQAYEYAVETLIRHLRSHYDAQIVLFAQCTGPTDDQDDRRIARRVVASVAPLDGIDFIDAVLGPEILKAAYRRLDVLVATRMHSAIFALSAGVPALVINYLHKSVGIMEMLGLGDYAVSIDQLQPYELCEVFDQLWRERAAIREHLVRRIPAIESTLAHVPALLREVL